MALSSMLKLLEELIEQTPEWRDVADQSAVFVSETQCHLLEMPDNLTESLPSSGRYAGRQAGGRPSISKFTHSNPPF